MPTIEPRKLVAYILAKTGCIHPFRISRILALAEIRYLERMNKRLMNLEYRGFDKVFYIEGLKEIIENDQCFKIIEGDPSRNIKGCVEYICEEPVIPSEVREVIDEAINTASNLSDDELNDLVIENPLFKKLLKPMNT